MPRHWSLGHRLPWVSVPLFGDRRRFGPVPIPGDPSWAEWLERYMDVYDANQKRGVGAVVNDAGYRVMGAVDLTGKQVLEVGPGGVDHVRWWRGTPARYVIADVHEEMLERATARLVENGTAFSTRLVDRDAGGRLPFKDEQFDVVVSFYSLEHLHPLPAHLDEIARVLRPAGVLVGAVPCEGGLAWGLGRLVTSRRWLKRHTAIDPDRIVCWEHPNVAETVLNVLDARMRCRRLTYWPLRVPSIDLNLVASFVYDRR